MIAENIARIRERIHEAAARTGRDANEITLMAVSKTFPATAIREAYESGLRIFGENRVQEFATKADEARKLSGSHFHLIGHLQSNKAAKAVELFDAVDSVDSFRLASRLNAAAKDAATESVILDTLPVRQVNPHGRVAPVRPPARKRKLRPKRGRTCCVSSQRPFRSPLNGGPPPRATLGTG